MSEEPTKIKLRNEIKKKKKDFSMNFSKGSKMLVRESRLMNDIAA